MLKMMVMGGDLSVEKDDGGDAYDENDCGKYDLDIVHGDGSGDVDFENDYGVTM